MASADLTRFFGSLNGHLEAVRESERQVLQQFFFDLSPRLETARNLDAELDRQVARRFNFFRYLRTDELGFSKMIADLLDPTGEHGQGDLFLRCLVEKLGFAKGRKLCDGEVVVEQPIADRRRLDIVVRIDNEHCLAIENKSNHAGDQRDQVKAYLCWLREHFSQGLLIYLSPTGEGPSKESVDGETIEVLMREEPRAFAIMPCGSGAEPDDDFNGLRLSFSLADWLADCRRNCDVDRLRWFLREAETYCRRRYGGSAVTNAESRAIKDFVLEGNRNVATAFAVYNAWPEVARQIKSQYMESILNKHLGSILNKLDENMVHYCRFDDRLYHSYVIIQKESWRPYLVDGKEQFTGLRMQAHSKLGNNYRIGIWSPPIASVAAVDRERRQSLNDAFVRFRQTGGPTDHWPWTEWVDEKYRYWDPLGPRLYQEIKEDGGEITGYFVQKFEEIAKDAVRLIDQIDGS